MAAGDVALSENQLIESLLADAEKRLSAQAASQDVAATGSKPASLVKIPKVLATTKSSSKKEEELSVRSVAPIQPKVCSTIPLVLDLFIPSPAYLHDENLSQTFHDAARYPVMGDSPAP